MVKCLPAMWETQVRSLGWKDPLEQDMPAPKTADQLFEERLKQFMTESDSKLSSLRQYADHRSKSRRR